MAKMTMGQYEKSGKDKDPKGSKEGSKADVARDKAALAKVNKGKK